MLKRIAVACAAFAAFGAPANAAPATPAATSRWVVDWDSARCSLARDVQGPKPQTVSFRYVPGSKVPDVELIEPSLQAGQNWEGKVDLRLEPSGAHAEGSGMRASVGDKSVLWVTFGGFGEDLSEVFGHLATSDAVALTADGRELAKVALPGAGKAVEALQKCTDQILKEWGLDPQVQANLRQHPKSKASLATWVHDSDYPLAALSKRESGTTTFGMIVDQDGRVHKCFLVATSGSPSLDQQTCAIMIHRTRFEPAISADGKPTPAVITARLRRVLPH